MQDCTLALRTTLSPWVSSILLMYFLLVTPPEYPFEKVIFATAVLNVEGFFLVGFFFLGEDAVGWIFMPVVRSREILVFRYCHDEKGLTLRMNLLFGSKLC